MADELDDGEFWLPSQFLTEEDILMDMEVTHQHRQQSQQRLSKKSSSSDSLSSDPDPDPATSSSSVDDSSITGGGGSTEAESDEDDLLAVLTRQMNLASHHHDCVSAHKPMRLALPSSPQSTLCPGGSGGGGGDGWSFASSRVTSPNGSVLSLSPTTDFHRKNDVAGGGVERQGTGYFDSSRVAALSSYSQQQKNHPTFTTTTSTQAAAKRPQFHHHHNQNFSQSRQLSRNHPHSHPYPGPHPHRQQQQSSSMNRPLGLPPSAWPPLKHNQTGGGAAAAAPPIPGSGMRAVFLGKKECSGTGVFLPRRADGCSGSNDYSRRRNVDKPACSTVLLPEKVVLALNNIKNTRSSKLVDSSLRFEHGNPHNNNVSSGNSEGKNVEIQLPSEWTY